MFYTTTFMNSTLQISSFFKTWARTVTLLTVAAVLSYSPIVSAHPGEDGGKSVTTLRDVRKLYIEKMPNGLDNYLRSAISQKLGSYFTIVLERSQADAILESSDTRSTGTINMVDPSHKVVLWSGSATDKDKAFLNLRHGGERQIAQKLVSQLKRALQ